MKSFLKIIVLTFYISVLNHNIYAQELKKTSKAIIKENFINGPLGRQPDYLLIDLKMKDLHL